MKKNNHIGNKCHEDTSVTTPLQSEVTMSLTLLRVVWVCCDKVLFKLGDTAMEFSLK